MSSVALQVSHRVGRRATAGASRERATGFAGAVEGRLASRSGLGGATVDGDGSGGSRDGCGGSGRVAGTVPSRG